MLNSGYLHFTPPAKKKCCWNKFSSKFSFGSNYDLGCMCPVLISKGERLSSFQTVPKVRDVTASTALSDVVTFKGTSSTTSAETYILKESDLIF